MTSTLDVALHPGEAVSIGHVALQRVGAGQVLVTAGTCSYIVDERIFDALVGKAVSEHCRRMSGPHAVWCDQSEHAKVDTEVEGGQVECVGRQLDHTIGGHEYGAWWRQDPGRKPVFSVEWPNFRGEDLSLRQVRARFRAALAGNPSEAVDQAAALYGAALDEYYGGDAWRGREL